MVRVGTLALLLMGCTPRTEIVLHYQLSGINLDDVVRVETLVSVDPADGRDFFADAPYRSLDNGVGIEVRDFNGTGQRQALVTQDATLGYRFGPSFIFTLLPPSGEAPPPLVFRARAMAAGTAIGATGLLSGKFGPGASLAVMLTDQRCNGVACTSAEACCSQMCLGITSDTENCGGCAMTCGQSGDSCAAATCRCAGGSSCPAGSDCCTARGCVDFTADPFNCGGCGNACNPGESCGGGKCACGGAAGCSAGQLCCGDGTCHASCACGAQVCMPPSQCCDAGKSLCADLSSDSQNCGTCGKACAAPLTCVAGACACNGVACAAGDICCVAGCRHLDDDPQNCGACGNDCGAGSACVGGKCMCGSGPCAAGQICCDATCVDPQSSSSHCGSCANSCSRGESCSGGMCGCGSIQCVGNETCCSDGCFDLQNSAVHCGASCSAPGCASGFACVSGVCQQTTCIPACSNGNSCVGTSCMCGSLPQCQQQQACCGTGCFDLSTSHDHCHSCTHACGPLEQCIGGACKRTLGQSCNLPGDCVSGHCSDGVCCNIDCVGACNYCALGGMLRGTCSPVQSGSDPHGLCVAHPSSACGTTGQCNAGVCADWPAGTSCAGPSMDKCSSPTQLVAWQCDGKDSCQQNQVDCGTYQCVQGTTASNAFCASGPCITSLPKSLCTVILDICAADSMCCFPLEANGDCSLTYCDRQCPL